MEFNKGLSSLIEVLKNIAVAQFRTLEKRIKSYEKFELFLGSFFELIDLGHLNHPFIRPRHDQQGVVAVTSDSGLLGGLNMQVVNNALVELEQAPGQLIVIGERGKMYARDNNVSFIAFPGINDEERHAQAMQMRDFLLKKISEGAFGSLKVVYPRPLSFTVQRVETITFLPFAPPSLSRRNLAEIPACLFESAPGELVAYLVYLWMGHKLFEIFGLSRLAEFSARYVHLEESLAKLKDMDNKLKLQYFKVRHELIDRNMRELFSARLLYANQ
ncbi:MAG: FoF1 ATP synthase subunit gamma [Candidatus Omnitrophota bacterium]